MAALESSLRETLKRLRIPFETPDEDTVLLRHVPANKNFFNKARTNVLVKRPPGGLPLFVCVDEDLEYQGEDAVLMRAFKATERRRGWRVLLMEGGQDADFDTAVKDALAALGFDGREPVLARPHAAKPGLIDRFARAIAEGPSVGRQDAVDEAAACVLESRAPLVVLLGESGVGKTHLLQGVARALSNLEASCRVFSIDLAELLAGTLFPSDREAMLRSLLKEASQPETVLALEHVHLAVEEVPQGALLLAQALDRNVKLLGTTFPCFRSKLSRDPLLRRLHFIHLAEPALSEALAMVLAHRDRLAAHHGLAIDESLVRTTLDLAESIPGRFPAKAIALLDHAAARARLSGAATLTAYHLYVAQSALEPEDRP